VSTTTSRQVHLEHVLVEVTSLLVDRARIQLEREVESSPDETAAADLRRLHELEKELRAIRRELGVHDPDKQTTTPGGRQVSKFYEVPGQEDA
jgi:hypothetical protein